MKFNSVFIYFSIFLFFFSQVNPALSQKVDSNLNKKISQPFIINGIILDQNNDPITQAGVIVLSKSTGTLTKSDGKFILYVPSLPVTLRITSPGCKSLDTAILINNSKLALKLNCDGALSKSEQEKLHKNFLEGRHAIPPLLRENIQLGRFADLDSMPVKVKYY